jgi:thioredoxin reductase (NADPH)
MAKTQVKVYDVAIIGTGAAGYTASIYASRYKLSNIVIGEMIGGQTAEAHLIQNFPSHKEIPGMELMRLMREHAEEYSVPMEYERVDAIDGAYPEFHIQTTGGKTIRAKTILLAIGQRRRKLGIPGEKEFKGQGITYCATCDAVFYTGKVVTVVGGSDAANTASLYLSTLAKKVYQVYRGEKLRGEVVWAEKVMNNDNIELILSTNIIEAIGTERLEAVKLDRPHNDSDTLKTDGLFIEIGSEPDTTLMDHLGVNTDETGFIEVNDDQTTNVKGIWAAGDITTASNRFHQAITAAAEGAIASENIYTTLQREETRE